MSSHVYVVDTRARKARIATTPGTLLSDILQQGCSKLGLDPALFVLKHNNKNLDLTRPIRHAGLVGGAQLELVQGSRSPTVISVALQYPHLDSSKRVTDRFPSSHSIWQILRAFETKESLNFTQRSVARIADANSTSGRLCYEMPAVHVANKELICFADLQKTLAQLGITSGNVLLRLNFKESTQPLEEAMRDMTEFFKEEPPKQPGSGIVVEHYQPNQESAKPASHESIEATLPYAPDVISRSSYIPHQSSDASNAASTSIANTSTGTSANTAAMSPFTIYNAPSTDIASRVVHNEADYEPTTEHALVHQSRLKKFSQNKRLPSDAEIAAAEQEKQAKLATVSQIQVRVRFPDLTQCERLISKGDTAQDFYKGIRSILDKTENKFLLRYYSDPSVPRPGILPDDAKVDLIGKLKWSGNQQVIFEWDASVSAEARNGPVLASEAMKLAKNLPLPVEQEELIQPEEKRGGLMGNLLKKDGTSSSMSSGAKEDKLKKLLGFGKGKKK